MKTRLYTCDDGHDEVCYACDKCPACVEKDKLADAEKECEQHQESLAELRIEIADLNDEIKHLKDPPTN